MTPELMEMFAVAPLPLTEGRALRLAAEWRVKHDVGWKGLARLMGEYHGVWRSPTWWRLNCQRIHGVPVNPRRAEVMRELRAKRVET